MSRKIVSLFFTLILIVAVIGAVLLIGPLVVEYFRPSKIVSASTILSGQDRKVLYLTRNKNTTIAEVVRSNGTVIVDDPNIVPLLDQDFPLDGFIFDAGLADRVDTAWLSARYLEGLVIAAVNLSVPELGKLVDEPSVQTDTWVKSGPPRSNDFSSMLYFAVGGDDPVEIQRYLKERPSLLTPDGGYDPMDGFTSNLQTTAGVSQKELADKESIQIMFADFMRAIDEVQAFKARGP